MLRILNFVFVCFTFLCLFSCKEAGQIDHLAHITDSDVKSKLAAACAASGGIDNYMAIDSITYDKRSVLYHADGSVESEVIQHHEYKVNPELSGIITWSDSLGDHSIVYNKTAPFKTLNGEKIANSSKSAKESFMSSYYVLFLPFKLIDPGVALSIEGTADIDGKKADMLKASYAPAVHDNHSTDDEWTFFLNQKDGSVLSNLVYHPPTYAYIENTEYTDEYPLRMNTYRQTWRTDKNRNKEYLRGEFWYSNYNFTEK